MGDDVGKHTVRRMSGSGSGGASAVDAETHSRCCPTGWSRSDTTALVVDNKAIFGRQCPSNHSPFSLYRQCPHNICCMYGADSKLVYSLLLTRENIAP